MLAHLPVPRTVPAGPSPRGTNEPIFSSPPSNLLDSGRQPGNTRPMPSWTSLVAYTRARPFYVSRLAEQGKSETSQRITTAGNEQLRQAHLPPLCPCWQITVTPSALLACHARSYPARLLSIANAHWTHNGRVNDSDRPFIFTR